MSLVLSIDMGTSGCRSAAFDQELNLLAMARGDYPLEILSERQVEQDANLWWEAVKSTVREVTAQLGQRRLEIRSIGISSQGISIVPIDREGNPLAKAISWLDTRAEQETAELKARFGRRQIFQKTGKRLSPTYTLPKLIWMAKHAERLYQQADRFLLPLDFIQNKLCGNITTDHTMAAGTMMYGTASQTWLEELLEPWGIDRGKLPEIAWAGTAVGQILPHMAQELGLPRETIVALGAQDQKCAAYGGGVSEDTVTVSLGTGSCIAKLLRSPESGGNTTIPVFSYLSPGWWEAEGVINTAGSALQWFRDKFAPQASFDRLTEMAAEAETGTLQFYPYLSGGASPAWAQGPGAFMGISLRTGIPECVRAIMEGVAYHIRANVDAMDGMGEKANILHLFGGGAQSEAWCQIIADVTGRTVKRLRSCETALAGAARLAYRALGVQTESLPAEQEWEPSPKRAAAYEAAYRKYEAMRERCFGEVAEGE